MDIVTMSMAYIKLLFKGSFSISLMKIEMNNGTETANKMTYMGSNMSIDISKGTNIDVRV